MKDDTLEVKIVIKLDSWKKKEVRNELLEFLKSLDIIQLEMEEK